MGHKFPIGDDEFYQKIINKAPIGDCEVVRLFNSEGEHKLSILACGIDFKTEEVVYDIATPDGKVKYCGLTEGVVETLKEAIGFATLPD